MPAVCGYRDLGVHDLRHLIFLETGLLRQVTDFPTHLGLPVSSYQNLVLSLHAYTHVFTFDALAGERPDAANYPWGGYDQTYSLAEREAKWNAFENYFPGDNYCDWVALSAYGPLTPRTSEGLESFRFKIDQAYPRLTKLVSGKPIIVAEFGCDLHNRHVDVVRWTRTALEDLFSNRWPAIVGFCWWNEGWQNDDHKKHDTDMIILHDVDLTRVFRDEFAQRADKIQETPVTSSR